MQGAPTTATRATLRDLLQAQVAALELAPKWLWEIEFALHIWPILERFHRDGDMEAVALCVQLRITPSVETGVYIIKHFLTPKKEQAPPW